MFDNGFQKSVELDGATFVPIGLLSDRDWQVLDWNFLRTKARNRIAQMIVNGELLGFYRVDVLMKALTKPHYYWPASEEMYDRYGDAVEEPEFFVNEPDEDADSEETEQIEETMARLGFMPRLALLLLIAGLIPLASLPEDQFRLAQIQGNLEDGQDADELDLFLMSVYLYQLPEDEREAALDAADELDVAGEGDIAEEIFQEAGE